MRVMPARMPLISKMLAFPSLPSWKSPEPGGFKPAGIGTALASAKGVANHLTAAGVLLGVLILGSLGAFFLYVPILPVAAAVTIMLALILMFVLGVQTGGGIRVLRRKNAAGSRVAE